MSARHGKQNRVVRVYFDVLLCFSASLDELPLCLTVYTKPAKKEEGYPHVSLNNLFSRFSRPSAGRFLFFLLRLARSEMRACSHFIRATTHQRLNTVPIQVGTMCDPPAGGEFRQYLGVWPTRNLYFGYLKIVYIYLRSYRCVYYIFLANTRRFSSEKRPLRIEARIRAIRRLKNDML